MITALFINTHDPHCGVHQLGLNLYEIVRGSEVIHWNYCDREQYFKKMQASFKPDVLVWNYQIGIASWMAHAPFAGEEKNILIYHDVAIDDSRWDAIIFPDPTMTAHGKWFSCGRPLPIFKPLPQPENRTMTIGCHGLVGAQADRVVDRVLKEFESAHVRLLLPNATYGDSNGTIARGMAERCREMVKGTDVSLSINHDFLSQTGLLEWLSMNNLNCFFRDVNVNWRGVSSAPDSAIAARRPLAVNRCGGFRHLHGLTPGIVIEDSSLSEIIRNGLSPLVPLYDRWSPETVRKQVEDVLIKIGG